MYTWHTLLHYPHDANTGCDMTGVAPVICGTNSPISGTLCATSKTDHLGSTNGADSWQISRAARGKSAKSREIIT